MNAEQLVARDRARQGLPARITDAETLRRVAALLRGLQDTDRSNAAERDSALVRPK